MTRPDAAGRATALARAGGHLRPLQGNARSFRERLTRALAGRPWAPSSALVSAELRGDPRLRLSYAGWVAAGLGPVDASALALGLGRPGRGPDELGAQALALAARGLSRA